MKKLSIYIHIPFCERKCLYCDFASVVPAGDVQRRYRDAIIDEITAFDSNGYTVDSIFIGGGTPTAMDMPLLRDIVAAVTTEFDTCLSEFSVECNPNSLTSEKLIAFREMGVTRLSIGVQSLNNEVLRAIGRLHDRDSAIKSIDMAVERGFRVSADIMVGLPGQTVEMVCADTEEIIAHGVEHLSCYSLILEEGTPLWRAVRDGRIILPDEDATVDMYDNVFQIAETRGLHRYEISNFGAPCLHNVGYWTLKDYAGFGLSAHSLLGNVRYYNTDDMSEYLISREHITEEVLSPADMAAEYVMLGLRMDRGVDIVALKERFGSDICDRMLSIASKQRQYLNITDTHFSIKRKYSYISNSIIAEFL